MAIQSRIAAVTGANKGIGLAIGTFYSPLPISLYPTFNQSNLHSPQSRPLLPLFPPILWVSPHLPHSTLTNPRRRRRKNSERRPPAQGR